MQQILESNQDYYIEEMYDMNGELVYIILPLDELWLDETENCSCKEKLEKQQHTIHERESLME